MGGLKHILLFLVFILILLDNEMLNLMLTTFKKVKSLTVFGLIWVKVRNVEKKLDKKVKMGIVNRRC